MNAGLPQGFVRLGTNHHLILKALLDMGPLRHRDLIEELGIEQRRVSVALAQLAESKLIHRHPVAPAYETGDRTQATWGLDRYRGTKPLHTVRVTGYERTKRYRAAKRRRVSSIFEYRP